MLSHVCVNRHVILKMKAMTLMLRSKRNEQYNLFSKLINVVIV